ncbi:MAG: nicotinate-nucleotide adenylyltransferase [Pseudomonadales bacterium]|nr:nicotinate-nucleotide adenylyltransferase [Pseudomonadales bacterium]
MSVAVFGGTFDPVHFGHLRAAVEVREALNAKVIRLMPAAIPWLKDQPGTRPEDRLAMLQAAVRDIDGLEADDRELRRGGNTYTVDTLQELRTEIGDSEPIYFAMGADAFSQLHRWREWQALFDLAHIVVMHRPGYRVQADPVTERFLAGRQATLPLAARDAAGRVIELPVTQLEISATDIRRRLANGQAVEFLMPPAVIQYINVHGLYQPVPNQAKCGSND